MRMLTIALTAVAVLALAAEAHADEWSFEHYLKNRTVSDWAGLGVGSMLHYRTTMEMSGMPGGAGGPGGAAQGRTTEVKETLVEIKEDGYVIKTETNLMGQWQSATKVEPKDKGWTPTVEDVGTETLTIDGTAYPCTKKKVTWKKGDAVQEVVTFWVHAEKGMLKMLAGENEDVVTVVTKFDQTWTVGEHSLKGREMSMTMPSRMGAPMKGSARFSPSVPNKIVRHEMTGNQGPVRVKNVRELVAFVKK